MMPYGNSDGARLMFTIHGIDHVVLRVRDMARMTAFYRDVLDCPVELERKELGLTQLRAGRSLIDLLKIRDEGMAAEDGRHNVDHFCLRIDPFDPDAIARHLRDHGVEPGEVGRRYGAEGFGPSLYLTDPEGNRVELKGPPEG